MPPIYDHAGVQIWHGDCLEVMPTLEAGSIDAIICDPPYGTTACSWDTVIPFVPMWTQIKRLVKPRAAVVLFGSQPFTSALVMSNPKWFRHSWVWNKCTSGSFQLAKVQPLRITEDLIVFGETGVNYYPQMTKGKMQKKGGHNGHPTMSDLKPYMEYKNDIYYPTNILTRANGDKLNRLHPTQKPLDLLRYLILTYTNPGDLVLDFAMGSGTTLVAAKQLGRKAIGIELDERYVNIAIDRLQQEVLNLV